ncbi:MAG TPA: glutathione S-transferase N-terminal domain-containing protein [Sphingomicrobium sp.]
MSLKLFYSPGACSIVPHIALHEAKAEFEPVKVVLAEGQHLKPEYLAINPHARVPALGTDSGVISENIAILNYIADEFGAPGSVPRGDPYVTAHCNQLLGWFASTVHISFAQVWRASRFTEDERVHAAIIEGGRASLERHFAEIEQLSGEGWLAGEEFSGADGYALIFFRWGKRIGMDMRRYAGWAALNERTLARDAVQVTLEREGWRADDFRAE